MDTTVQAEQFSDLSAEKESQMLEKITEKGEKLPDTATLSTTIGLVGLLSTMIGAIGLSKSKKD